MKEIHISDWSKQRKINHDHFCLIDVRSPLEFKDGHIPGAINIPLFSDEERATIGTIYKQEGQNQARWKAMEIVSPKIPQLLSEMKEHTTSEIQPLIYCWRGGARSKSLCTFADLAGLPNLRLTGGYKAYRTWCAEQLQKELLQGKKPILLHGMTGVGKTLILQRLASRHPTLDLEQLANHRGSIFGSFGLGEPHNQRTFEALFIDRLHTLEDAQYLILEAESRRIGKVTLPEFIMEWRKEGIHFTLQPSLYFRINIIMQEYVESSEDKDEFAQKALEAFTHIQKRLLPVDRAAAEQMLMDKDFSSFIQLMLVKYYDPLYQSHEKNYTGEHIEITYETIAEAVDKINEYLTF